VQNLLASLKRAFKQPAFVVVVTILVLAAAGLNAATELLELHFRKLPVPLARELSEVPARLGPWRQVSIDVPLPPETEKVLGTKQYIARYYVDTRIIPDKELDEMFKDKTPRQCADLALNLQFRNDRAVVELWLSYYTGMVDTVAHVPERCMTASGFEATERKTLGCGALKDRGGDQSFRFLVFEPAASMLRLEGPGTRPKYVRNFTYFFNCNGEYTSDSIGVRTRLANLFQTYGYYMKIETQVFKSDADTAVRTSTDLLSYAMPEIEKCLPDWNKYKSAR
jgi:hypothetical protein